MTRVTWKTNGGINLRSEADEASRCSSNSGRTVSTPVLGMNVTTSPARWRLRLHRLIRGQIIPWPLLSILPNIHAVATSNRPAIIWTLLQRTRLRVAVMGAFYFLTYLVNRPDSYTPVIATIWFPLCLPSFQWWTRHSALRAEHRRWPLTIEAEGSNHPLTRTQTMSPAWSFVLERYCTSSFHWTRYFFPLFLSVQCK